MNVAYVGQFAAVDIEVPAVGWQTVEQGGTIDVPADYALSLMAQPANWAPADEVAMAALIASEPEED